MKFVIIVFIFISLKAFSEKRSLMDEFVDYGVRINNISEESEKVGMACALKLIFQNLSDKEKGYLQVALNHSQVFPNLSDFEVSKQVKEIYDKDGSITSIIQKKIDVSMKEIRECFQS